MADKTLERIGVTLAEVMALGEDARVEVIDGVLVTMSPVGGLHQLIGGNIYFMLAHYLRQTESGSVFYDGLIFLMGESKKHLKDSFVPDLSFIRNESIPANWDVTKPFPGAPDLAVEILSPDDDAEELLKKVRKYLAQGTQEVWLVYPENRELHQYRQGQTDAVQVYRDDQALDVTALFPGLQLTAAAIFKLPSWAQR